MKNLLARFSNWKFIIPSLIGFLYCLNSFNVAQANMSAIAGSEVEMIDLRKNYDLEEINDFFTRIKEEGRQIHRYATGVTDMIFPFLAPILLALSHTADRNTKLYSIKAVYPFGIYQIGDDQARSWMVASRSARGDKPARIASHVDQRQVGFSKTRV